MKLTIFGATGRTGRPLVEQALAAGHQVVAFARTLAKMDIEHPNLKVVQGDAMNAAEVASAIEGADAVLNTLGQTKKSPPNLLTVASQNIVAGMEKHGVKRLVSLTGGGVDWKKDRPKFINHLIKFALKTFSGRVLKDAERHAEIIQNSDLEWTIVRGPMLTEEPYSGDYRVGYVGVNTGARLSRNDLAAFMLKEVENPEYIHDMPMLSN